VIKLRNIDLKTIVKVIPPKDSKDLKLSLLREYIKPKNEDYESREDQTSIRAVQISAGC
jgi:hypothetical protein